MHFTPLVGRSGRKGQSAGSCAAFCTASSGLRSYSLCTSQTFCNMFQWLDFLYSLSWFRVAQCMKVAPLLYFDVCVLMESWLIGLWLHLALLDGATLHLVFWVFLSLQTIKLFQAFLVGQLSLYAKLREVANIHVTKCQNVSNTD